MCLLLGKTKTFLILDVIIGKHINAFYSIGYCHQSWLKKVLALEGVGNESCVNASKVLIVKTSPAIKNSKLRGDKGLGFLTLYFSVLVFSHFSDIVYSCDFVWDIRLRNKKL